MSAAPKKAKSSTSRKPGRPRHADMASREHTAQHIKRHAKKLFAQHGFSAVSIHDIVLAAEVSKPTLYYYFPDKEQLYTAVLGEVIEAAGSFFSQATQQPGPLPEKLTWMAEGFFEHSPASLPCLFREVSQHLSEPAAKKIMELYRQKVFHPLDAMFADCIKQQELDQDCKPWLLAEFFLTLLDWMTLRFSFNQKTPVNNKAKAMHVVELFMGGSSGLGNPQA